MSDENPTATGGASISERIEAFLTTAEEAPQQNQEAAPEGDKQAPEVEAPTPDALAEDDEPQLSVTDLAKYLGIDESALDVDDDGAVLVKTKIDGQDGAAKFQDLLKSYQLQGHIDNKARAAAEQEKALQERVGQFEAYAKQQSEHLATLANIAQQELLNEANAINWDELSRNDPAGYVAQQHIFQQRQARVNQLVQQAEYQRQQVSQQEMQRRQTTMQQEAQRLTTAIPEWADQSVRAAEVDALVKWSTEGGFPQETLKALHEASIPGAANIVAAMRKAMMYDKGKTAEAITEKKIRTAPKLVKPGQSTDARQRQQDGVRSLKENIRKSGGKQGVAEYLLATGKV